MILRKSSYLDIVRDGSSIELPYGLPYHLVQDDIRFLLSSGTYRIGIRDPRFSKERGTLIIGTEGFIFELLSFVENGENRIPLIFTLWNINRLDSREFLVGNNVISLRNYLFSMRSTNTILLEFLSLLGDNYHGDMLSAENYASLGLMLDYPFLIPNILNKEFNQISFLINRRRYSVNDLAEDVIRYIYGNSFSSNDVYTLLGFITGHLSVQYIDNYVGIKNHNPNEPNAVITRSGEYEGCLLLKRIPFDTFHISIDMYPFNVEIKELNTSLGPFMVYNTQTILDDINNIIYEFALTYFYCNNENEIIQYVDVVNNNSFIIKRVDIYRTNDEIVTLTFETNDGMIYSKTIDLILLSLLSPVIT